MKTTILLLLICGTISAQYTPSKSTHELCKTSKNVWAETPPENYVAGLMLIGSFYTVERVDRQLFDVYGRDIQRTQKRNVVAATCMATTIVTFVAVKETRKFIEKKNKRRRVNRINY
jgi:hypothetical protein